MRQASILLIVVCGCSARVDEPATDAGGDTHLAEASTSCPSSTDACRADVPDGSSYDPAQYGAKQLLNECLLVERSCGNLHVDVDDNGCVVGHWLARADRPKFASCIADALARVRFPCVPAGEFIVTIDSCTIPK